MANNQNIPFLDLIGLHAELEGEIMPVIQKTLRTAGFIGGPVVEEFEREFARFCDASHCVGVASGTDAVLFALLGAGVQRGDVVVTVPHTFIATTEGITQAGARADFVDINERDYCMDPQKLQQYFEQDCYEDSKTGKLFHKKWNAPVTAVVPVHLYGQTADMDPILELAQRYKLLVIEDACQAHGAEYFSRKESRWKKAGSMGHAAAFSFYPGKNLGACGDAGALTTNDPAIAKKVSMLRDHGQARKYYHEMEGYNGRLDALQAGILQVKLRHLPDWNQKRRQIAARYGELLRGVSSDVVLPYEPSWSRSVYHLYVVQNAKRDEMQEHLTKAGIGTGIHYPVPVHLQKPYLDLGFKEGDFLISEKAAARILSLPMFPGLSPAQQDRVVEEISRFVKAPESLLSVQPAGRA